MEPEEKLVSAGIADGGRNDPSFDVIAAQNRISAPAAPRVDGGIEVHEQGGDDAPWEAVLLQGAVVRGGEAHLHAVVEPRLVVARDGLFRAFLDEDGRAAGCRQDPEVAARSLAAHAADARDRDARDFGLVVVVARVGGDLAVGADGGEAQRELGRRAHLPVIAGGSHKEIHKAAVVAGLGRDAQDQTQSEGEADRFSHTTNVRKEIPGCR